MPKAKKVTYGYQLYRLKDNPEERRFSRAWHEQQAGKTLAHLLAKSHNVLGPPDPSDDANNVAATVIQWLGSSLGQAFLRDLGYTKAKPTADEPTRLEQRRAKRVARIQRKMHMIQKSVRDINIEILNIDNPDE